MDARSLGIEVAAATALGRRKINADALLIDEAAGLLAVADGMGDEERSAEVARMALAAVRETFGPPWSALPPSERTADEAAERFLRGMVSANERVHEARTAEQRRIGTTFAGVAVCGDFLCVAHAGDSRVYLVLCGTATPARLTEDHTRLAELLARGVPRDMALDVAKPHALTRAIGIRPALEVHPVAARWTRGDVVILCTDGVSDHVRVEDMTRTLAGTPHVEQAARCLVDAASDHGGWDNATVVAACRVG
jgi:protein phosphatase